MGVVDSLVGVVDSLVGVFDSIVGVVVSLVGVVDSVMWVVDSIKYPNETIKYPTRPSNSPHVTIFLACANFPCNVLICVTFNSTLALSIGYFRTIIKNISLYIII